MKICNTCNIEKPLDCFHKHTTGSYGVRSYCKECASIKKKQNKHKHIVVSKETSAIYYLKNKDKINKKHVDYYEENKEKVLSTKKNWKKQNSDKVNFYSAKRRCSKKQATLNCLTEKDLEDIYSYYLLAKELTLVSGVSFHVDHIVPLTNDIVCGLNVPWNLQILTEKENLNKSNKFNEESIFQV